MDAQVEHDREGHRFHALVAAPRAVLDYRVADRVMTITHTGVPPEIEGRGVAAALTRAAVEAAKADGWKVHPRCEYAAAWLKRHKEYADIVV
jgi:predicted GNAT family acetyltransferase